MAVVDGAGVVSASYERLASVAQGLSENFEQLRERQLSSSHREWQTRSRSS